MHDRKTMWYNRTRKLPVAEQGTFSQSFSKLFEEEPKQSCLEAAAKTLDVGEGGESESKILKCWSQKLFLWKKENEPKPLFLEVRTATNFLIWAKTPTASKAKQPHWSGFTDLPRLHMNVNDSPQGAGYLLGLPWRREAYDSRNEPSLPWRRKRPLEARNLLICRNTIK